MKMDQRSQEKERIDSETGYFTSAEYADYLKTLFRVNRLLGFFRATVKVLKSFPQAKKILDVGCGDGLFILHLSEQLPDRQFKGIEISQDAIACAKAALQEWKKTHSSTAVSFDLQLKKSVDLADDSVDISVATLVCHHLDNETLVNFLKNLMRISRLAVVINDLERHPFAHWLFGLLSPILFRNQSIRHDGLISIRRGFRKSEWLLLLEKAGIRHYRIKQCFPFCWQLVLLKD